jgi:SAM-dependent methyltransferase
MSVDKHFDFTRIRPDYEGYRELASTPGLSKYNRICAPDSYREGRELAIFEDIRSKLPALDAQGARIADIGCGCTDMPGIVARHVEQKGGNATFIDSPEMLQWLPDSPAYRKLPGQFPGGLESFLAEEQGTFDGIICYSVIQAIFPGGDLYTFFDSLLRLLAPRGRLLIGDIPNISRRKRFFASETGIAHHKAYMNTTEDPVVAFNVMESGHFDDAIIFGLLMRARAAGYDAYVVPQHPALPMANRREDILVERP